MNTKKSSNQFLDGSVLKKYDITNILYQYVAHNREQGGQGDGNKSDITIALYPSEYKKQLSLSTKNRLELISMPTKLSHQSSQSCITVDNSFPLKVIPKEIIFQQFSCGHSYSTFITISNVAKTSHFIKLICEENETFRIDHKGSTLNTRLAPGMSHMYNIQFNPNEKRDYEYEIILMGDFIPLKIPIIALGPRAILDFPDRIIMPKTAVNIKSSKTILVRNVGDSVSIFSTSLSSPYFSMEPSCGVIKEKENLQFTINFLSPIAGNFSGIIYLKYETGELLRIDVHGIAFNCNIKLEKEEVMMDDTFISLSTVKSIKIYNDSDHIVKFQWMKYKDAETDSKEKKKFMNIYNSIIDHTTLNHADLDYTNEFDSNIYETICKRVHTDEMNSLDAEKFLYHDSIFILTPMIGEIWPKNFVEIMIYFQPKIIGEISSKAYLDITGCETRLSMSLYGIGRGPILKLNATTIDMGNVYLSSVQNFDIICANEGLIPGILIPKTKSSDFGGKIKITPEILEIQPNEYSSFNLSFSSLKSGEFIETVEFFNQDNSETLFLYIKGHVICPSLHFNQPQLDLGVVALGFTFKREITIRNDSSVPVTFNISIPDDGNEPPITIESFINARNTIPPLFPSNPREFSISPNSTRLNAYSSLSIKVNFTPNIERIRKSYLEVIIEGSDTVPITLPILFVCKVASCTLESPRIYIRFAFINYPYTSSFIVKNTSDVEGFFYFVREPTPINSTAFYSMSKNQWHLKPGQSRAASVTIITREIGQQKIEMKIRIFGKNELDTFTVEFNGHGPVISSSPKYLDFGEVGLLQEQSMPLELINDSPIPANFKAHIANKNSPWSISIASGEINPLKSIEIIVKLFLRDTGKQFDKILIAIANSSTISVSLTAHGSGSCILIDPNIFPDFNIGQLLSHQDNFVPINLINEGNRWQKLTFSNTTTIRNSRSVPQMPKMTTFKIEAHVIDLPPRSTKKIEWLIYSDTCKTIVEQWWVYVTIHGHATRELIGMSNFLVTFVEPTVKFNKTELNFYINMESDNPKLLNEKIIDELEVMNTSQINLKMNLSVQYPFAIISENGQRVNDANLNLNHDIINFIKICFAPNIKDTQFYSKHFVEYLQFKYDRHPNTDEIRCRGAVNYPNIIPIPRELRFDVSLNNFISQTLLLNNDGPIPVNYQFSWINDNINVQYIHKISSPTASKSCMELWELKDNESDVDDFVESLQDVTNEFTNEAINHMFEISSMNGIVSPYSNASISIGFHARDAICLSAQLLCQVLHGPSESIKVTARVDTIKYSLDKTHINFGCQPLFKTCHDIIEFSNTCEIKFHYKIEISLENQINNNGILSIKPMEGSLDPEQIVEIELNYQSRIPGLFEESFNIIIGTLKQSVIIMSGLAVFPQVYLQLPRISKMKNYPIENEYNAINNLKIIKKINIDKNNVLLKSINGNDFQRLINIGWDVISRNDENVPDIMDIEMAIEQYLTIQHINENKILTNIHISSKDPMPIPSLFSPTYELNLGYAIIEQYTTRSVVIINYSSCKISVRMKKIKNENYLTKYGMTVKFRNSMNLMPREFSTLDISIYPLEKSFSEYNKFIKKKIYIEVINGCTIPITIIATVTSPRLILNTNYLDFGDVAIGNCQLLHLFIQNHGLIDCQCKMEFSNLEKKSMYFFLNNYCGDFAPGESQIIDIYFKPKKSGYRKAELKIIVKKGLAQQKIILYGRGIEKNLKVVESFIEFPPTTLYSIPEIRELNIKNISNCPIEFYWHHLDDISIEEDRVIEVLLHYYRVEEILLPLINVGSTLPQRLYKFYYSLIDNMMSTNTFISNGYIQDVIESQETSEFSVDSQLPLDNSHYEFLDNQIPLRSRNPDELKNALYSYIDKLHENPDFLQLRDDPLREIFNELHADDRKEINTKKRVCIFFHGAPFTQYQETACRVANNLGVALINLDSAITEIIALGDSSNSVKLRNLIDDKYHELLEIAMGLMNNFNHIISPEKEVAHPVNSISEKNELENFKKNINFHLPEPDDPAIYLKNILNIDEINSMKPLCRYEYLIEGILLLWNIIDKSEILTTVTTDGSKSVRQGTNKNSRPKEKIKQEKTFLNVELSLFKNILWEIFSNDKYKKGFVLQTLNNHFIENNVSTFSLILQIIGQIDFMAFVTFHNSLELYQQKFVEKQNEIVLKEQEELSMRLKIIDEMSSSDFELLPDHEKKLFFTKVSRPRINEAQQRRTKFKTKYQSTEKLNSIVEDEGMSKNSKKKDKKHESVEMKDKKQKKIDSEKILTATFINYKTSLKYIESMIKDYFHIWYVKSNDPWNPKIYDLIVDQMTHNQLIKQILIENENFKSIPKPQLYSVISKKYQRHKCSFSSKSAFELVELSCDLNINENDSNSSTLQKSIAKIPQARTILEPNEDKTFRIIFDPTRVDSFAHKYELSIAGVNNKCYCIDVVGKVNIPQLQMDPNIIFEKVENIKKSESNDPTFFIDKKIFDFGYLLAINVDDDQSRVHSKISRFNFFNPSLINVDVEFSLANDNWKTFNLAPRTLSIGPNEFGSVEVSATALKLDINTDQLLIMIKNNPHIEKINLECSGCKLNVELSPKNLSFGPVLLFRNVCKILKVKNKTAIPIFWKILQEIPEESQITFLTLSNWVKAFSQDNIEICYNGQEIGPLKKTIELGIFSDEFNENLLLLETIIISGETYDVAVDINNANPINFNCGKIGRIIEASFTIKNRGQHDINFMIELENKEKIIQIHQKLLKNLKEDLHINPKFGLLIPNKKTTVNVTFVSKLELNLESALLLKCNLWDSNANPTIVAELPLTVTIRTEYSKFDIEPYPELFFGPVRIFTHKQIPFYIKNIGIFPIRYRITSNYIENFPTSSTQSQQPKKKDEKNPTDHLESRKSRKTPKKEKPSPKINRKFLKFGPFTLKQNHEGTLDVNQVKELVIDFYSDAEGHSEKEIFILIDNCSIEDKNGKKLKLSADTFTPKINFNDLDSIFQDSHVVNSIKDFNCPSEIEPFSIFTKEEMCLYFERVAVSSTHTVKLKLYNTSLVPAEVSMRLKPDALSPKKSLSTTFSLDQTKLYIPALNSQTFTISFTPTLIETYTGLLEVFVDILSYVEQEKLSIKLSGEGYVAEINLHKPEIFCKRGHAIIEFGKCLVGETSIKDICFKNVGKICAKVTIEIIEDIEFLYELKINHNTNQNTVKIIERHCIEVNSKPEEVTELLVLFSPKDKGKYEAHVRLLIIENPYESLMINLNGEGFIEPVIFTGVPLYKSDDIDNETTVNKQSNETKRNDSYGKIKKTSRKQSRSSSVASSINTKPYTAINLIYILNMGSCFLNEEKKMSFKIVNKSVDKLFRFEWKRHDNFTIKPSIGHIYCLDDKDITVTFTSNNLVIYNQIPLDCTISEIEILDKPVGVAWDDQHTRVDWIESLTPEEEENIENSNEVLMEKTIYSVDEPIHEILNPSHLILLLLSASAADPIYSNTINEINFGDIFMFETQEEKFELTNPSIVNLIYSWKITDLSIHHSTSSANYSREASSVTSINESNESFSRSQVWESLNDEKCETSFEIEPECGILLPGRSKIFTVRFSPHNAMHYQAKLTCNIEHLDPEMSPLEIVINGTGLLPYYHFDIPKNKYLSHNVKPAISPDVKIVEFKVIGIGKNYIKHFNLINPTSTSYNFSWIDKTSQNNDSIPYFHCKIQNGTAESGKKTRITFTFLARQVGIFEASWAFLIRKYNLEVPFLLVGIVTEPQVNCCTPKIIIPSTFIGAVIQQFMILRNNEELPLSFYIVENSVYSEGGLQSIFIEPKSGILSPKNDQKFLINFIPSRIGNFSFILQCQIERMKEPLKCFIHANVCKFELHVTFLKSSSEKIKMQANKVHVIELGKLMLKKLININFEIKNMADIAIEYTWNLNLTSPTIFRNNQYKYNIEMNPINGQVENKSKIISTLQVIAMKKLELKNHPITLKITNGPIYKLLINATAKRAPIEFNFVQYNFGACYIKQNFESSPYKIELQITNNENTFAIVECNSHLRNFIFNLEILSRAIPKHSAISIPIEFQPREMKKYHETLIFKIDSDIEQKIELKGEGITHNVSLITPRDKFIDFGGVPIGKIAKRKFTIINLAKVSVKLKIGLMKESTNSLNKSDLLTTINHSITFEPSELLTLRSNKSQGIIIKYSPTERMNLFEEKIYGFCTDSTIIPLSFVRGRCIAAEFNLNQTHVLFDTVVIGSSINDKLILCNSGDIGARFKWNIKKLGSYFTLKPLTGYSSAGKNVTFNVCFRPMEQSNNIKGEAFIEIENYQNIKVLFSGGCSNLPDPTHTIMFCIPVRSTEIKNIDVLNDTNFNDEIEIIITGNYFYTESTLFINAHALIPCAVTYAPLVMNSESNPHEGTLMIKFSRRNSVKIYALRGISLPPKAIGEILREVPSKIKYFETLPVYNWLNENQHFICTIKLIGHYKEQPIYTFHGSDNVEILSNSARDYKATFCCYKGSLLNFNIIFMNPEGEYQFYELKYKIIKPEIIETIELTTITHVSSTYLLKIENPLQNDSVTYSANCQHPDIKILGLPRVVTPKSHESITIHYSPIIPSESEATLNVTATKLGIFPYKLKLKAARPEKVHHTLPQITASLGSSKIFNIPIKNDNNKIDEFTIAINNPSFTCKNNKISISARDECTIEVTYEPCNIEIVHAELIISSTMNSEIIYHIIGNGTAPKPKGPFILTPNQPLAIPFKNVFFDAKKFQYVVDPTISFTASSSSNIINSKQTANIMVKFQDMNEFDEYSDSSNGIAVTGKLIVYCTDPELSSINWIYYLKGTLQ